MPEGPVTVTGPHRDGATGTRQRASWPNIMLGGGNVTR